MWGVIPDKLCLRAFVCVARTLNRTEFTKLSRAESGIFYGHGISKNISATLTTHTFQVNSFQVHSTIYLMCLLICLTIKKLFWSRPLWRLNNPEQANSRRKLCILRKVYTVSCSLNGTVSCNTKLLISERFSGVGFDWVVGVSICVSENLILLPLSSTPTQLKALWLRENSPGLSNQQVIKLKCTESLGGSCFFTDLEINKTIFSQTSHPWILYSCKTKKSCFLTSDKL